MALAVVLADSTEGSPVVGALLVIGGAVGILAYHLRDRRRHPYVPCSRCGGQGRRWSRWTRGAYGFCPKCGGRPQRRRGLPPE